MINPTDVGASEPTNKDNSNTKHLGPSPKADSNANVNGAMAQPKVGNDYAEPQIQIDRGMRSDNESFW